MARKPRATESASEPTSADQGTTTAPEIDEGTPPAEASQETASAVTAQPAEAGAGEHTSDQAVPNPDLPAAEDDYEVLYAMRFNNKRYKAGDPIKLSEAEHAALLADELVSLEPFTALGA